MARELATENLPSYSHFKSCIKNKYIEVVLYQGKQTKKSSPQMKHPGTKGETWGVNSDPTSHLLHHQQYSSEQGKHHYKSQVSPRCKMMLPTCGREEQMEVHSSGTSINVSPFLSLSGLNEKIDFPYSHFLTIPDWLQICVSCYNVAYGYGNVYKHLL